MIEKNPNLTLQAERFRNAQKLIVNGRGFNYCTAFEIALKLKETSYFVAEPYSVADLLHGPVAMIDPGFPVVLVAPSGKTMIDVPSFLSLLEQRGAELLAISDVPSVLARAASRIELPAGVPEWLSPIVAVVPGQLFAGALALRTGQNPDHPRGLSKITMTR